MIPEKDVARDQQNFSAVTLSEELASLARPAGAGHEPVTGQMRNLRSQLQATKDSISRTAGATYIPSIRMNFNVLRVSLKSWLAQQAALAQENKAEVPVPVAGGQSPPPSPVTKVQLLPVAQAPLAAAAEAPAGAGEGKAETVVSESEKPAPGPAGRPVEADRPGAGSRPGRRWTKPSNRRWP